MIDWKRVIESMYSGDITTVRSMLEADPALATARNEQERGATLLHYAAWHGCVELAALLLERGADLEAVETDFGSTPLGWANESKQKAMIVYLLSRGARASVWQLAAAGKVERLKEHPDRQPADLNATGNFGTPLHEAILHGRVQAVEYLLSRGADPTIRNRHGHTALELAGSAKEYVFNGSALSENQARIAALLSE